VSAETLNKKNTASSFIFLETMKDPNFINNGCIKVDDVIKLMTDFAKLHVKIALEKAEKEARGMNFENYYIANNILLAYPEGNIE